jgi:hypothetical protein
MAKHWSDMTEVELIEANISLYLDSGHPAYAKCYITKLRKLRRNDDLPDPKKPVDSPPPRKL